MEVGLRVIRGPDWQWGDQDGGEGHVGTVAEELQRGEAVVQWDLGGRCKYRCGLEGKYDLRVLDNAPTGVVHHQMQCTWCDETPIMGTVWKCAFCYGYYLCTHCYMADKHSVDHPFDRCHTKDHKKRVRVPPRFMATKVPVMGMFIGAEVVRGCDWRWKDQDGGKGNVGHVTKIQGWKKDSFRSVVVVMWRGATENDVYRRAHHGKVDVMCVTAASGGCCYVDHLPLLGYQYAVPKATDISAGLPVMVQINPDIFKIAQEDHGGWDNAMATRIGQVGVVKCIEHKTGDAYVHYGDNTVLLLNKDILTVLDDIHVFHYGDVVRVIDDMPEVYSLQIGHGEWNDNMSLALGQIGRVLNVAPNYDLEVMVNGHRWHMNPKCFIPVPEDIIPFDLMEGGEAPVGDLDCTVQQKYKLLCLTGSAGLVPAAALLGDTTTLRQHLEKRPQDVNCTDGGKGALHLAVIKHFLSVIKLVLQFSPDVNIKDDDGERPLHMCARRNDAEVARLLIDAGADVNAKEFKGIAPIETAAALGHIQMLKTLVDVPSADINAQDGLGKTALHHAMSSKHPSCIRLLLEHGADPSMCDFDFFTPMHLAARYLPGAEEILRFCPHLVNLKKEDGYTVMQVAAVNDNVDIVAFLASHPSCNLESLTGNSCTVLHLAVIQGYTSIIEKLVGYGADLNATLRDGNTPLHIVLVKVGNMKQPSKSSPEMLKIQDEVEANYGVGVVSADMIVALFLVTNGTDIHLKNHLGQSPLSMCAVDMTALFKEYSERSNSFRGSLKELPHPFTDPPKPVKKQAVHTRPPTDVQATTPTSPLSHESERRIGHTQVDTNPPDNSSKNLRDTGELDEVNQLLESVDLSLKKDILSCFLCEGGVDIKLLPCGHTNMCHECPAAKRCPTCRVLVSKQQAVCVLCQSEKVVRTMEPCGHTYCSGCGCGLGYCEACRQKKSEQ